MKYTRKMQIKNPYIISKSKINELQIKDDVIENNIGAIGLWQVFLCILASVVRFMPIWHIYTFIFLTPKIAFKCVKINNSSVVELQNNTCYKDCIQYEIESLGLKNNLVTEFGLICEDAWMANVVQTVLRFGLLVGGTVFGWISDRFGRRTGILIAICLIVSAATGICFVHNYWLFNSLRFVIGFSSGGILVISIVVCIENIGSKYRDLAACFAFTLDPIAQGSLVIFALISESWNTFLFYIAVVSFVFLSYILILPESPRWLTFNDRVNDAVKVLTRAAKWNKMTTSNIRTDINNAVTLNNSRKSDFVKTSFKLLLTNKDLRYRSIMCYPIWCVLGVCVFGLSQYITFVGKDIYVSNTLTALSQLPVAFVALFLNKYFGRKITVISTLAISGALMLTSALITNNFISMLLLFFTTFVLGISFTTIYIFTSELFPTSVRNLSLGLAIAGLELGAMSAPFITSLQPRWLPSVVFGVLSLLAVIPCVFLPETKGLGLKDDI